MKNSQTVIVKTKTLTVVITIHINISSRLSSLVLCLIFISNSWVSFMFFLSVLLLHAERMNEITVSPYVEFCVEFRRSPYSRLRPGSTCCTRITRRF